MKRIDRIISEHTDYSRKDIKKLISKGLVFVNDKEVKHPEDKYEDDISITINGIEIDIRNHVYLVLNKPKGFVSTTDLNERSVLELVPDEYMTRDLFPAGRLDKDTTGLMIITDDGEFAHNILSPKKHVQKIYEVTLDIPVSEEMKKGFLKGVNLSDGECKSAILDITGEYTCKVTLKEGRYHQIKRMFGCYKAKVVELNRICMGDFYLPKDLKQGEIRELTSQELDLIQSK
jgi:16S rRNA pseudouridine516 synthase